MRRSAQMTAPIASTFAPSPRLFTSLRIQLKDAEQDVSIPVDGLGDISHESARVGAGEWDVSGSYIMVGGHEEVRVRCELRSGGLTNFGVSLVFECSEWNDSNYVMVPGAIYAGNSFASVSKQYPPSVYLADPHGPDVEAVIADIPRLGPGPCLARLELLSGDAATPAVCVFDPARRRGCIVLFPHQVSGSYTGLAVLIPAGRESASVSVSAPGIRTPTKYSMCSTSTASNDRLLVCAPGDIVELRIEVHEFECDDVPELFAKFEEVRRNVESSATVVDTMPFSRGALLISAKHNDENWNPEYGYYSVGTTDDPYQDFQTGWVGGGISTYPLYFAGGDECRDRALRTLDFMFAELQTESGFLYGIYHHGQPLGDAYAHPDNQNWLLIRKNADFLYFALKLRARIPDLDARRIETWDRGLTQLADAFVRLWNKYGQWGQFIDIAAETIEVGGSSSAATAVAGLVLASKLLENPEYLRVAQAAAEHFYANFTSIGVTTGGPGDALQAPDSESAFALLESYLVLYENTNDPTFLTFARHAADQAMSWCVSYDFRFPITSEFGRLDIRTTGSVYANAQNKHSAPGICTFSGNSLLKLFRHTGEGRYLRQAVETAHNILQYLSTEERPIRALRSSGFVAGENYLDSMSTRPEPGDTAPPLPFGYMNERVNMSDWEGTDMVGEIFAGSTWAETTALLTTIEFPSVYVVADLSIVEAFDSLEARLHGDQLWVHNPTTHSARASILIESAAEMSRPYDQALAETHTHLVGAGETILVAVRGHH
jgi:hypothetical protein